MDTRDVLVVDVFAESPATGTPVGVVPDGTDLVADQRAAIAAELGTSAVAFVGAADETREVHVAGERASDPPVPVALATAASLRERGALADDRATFAVGDRTVEVTAESDGRTWVEVDEPDIREAEVTEEEVATALGVDVAAIRDVGADLPLVRASLGDGVLLVPVNFLEHLSGATPEVGTLEEILAVTATETLYAFTFDTLGTDGDVHGLAVGPGGPRARTDGTAAACAAAALKRHGAFEHDREVVRFEEGDLCDRPARIDVRTGEVTSVGGRTVTVLDGTVVVPPSGGGDDIIEA